MLHLPVLIQDLGFILGAAALVTLLCKRLKQPVVLGYLIAGFLVGPHVPFLPTVAETGSIKVWAEIGVIFLLFGLGLEFSFKKLAKVGRSASLTACFEIIFMMGIGYLTGQALGWSPMDSIFLGGILAISSTTIIVRAFQELGLKGRRFVSLVFGVLVIEDLIAILLLVLLSTIAVTQTLAGGELLGASLKLGFFLLLWFVVGIYAIPLFLKVIRSHLNDETMLVVSIGLCLGMVMLATEVGFSPALGAFVMGSILSETREGERIEHLITPVRDLFAAVFFVSVGMLLDPKVLVEHSGAILLITFLTIFGKFLSSGLGALLAGEPLKTSVQAGMSLAQIGEFSFIIATLGLTLKVTSDFLYPIAVAVSAITTFTTPYLIREADRLSDWIERSMPQGLRERLNSYQRLVAEPRPGVNKRALLWDAYGPKIILNGVIVVALALGMKKLLQEGAPSAGSTTLEIGAMMLTLVLASPFLWGVTLGKPAKKAVSCAADILQLRNLQFGLTIVRSFLGICLVFFVVSQFSRTGTAAVIAFVLFSFSTLLISRFAEPLYSALEERFVANLNEKEIEALSSEKSFPELAPWDATLTPFVVSPESELVGKSLLESKLKERFGVTVALIERGRRRIQAPTRQECLYPGDRVYLIGTEDQFEAVRPALETPSDLPETLEPSADGFGLASMVLREDSSFVNKTIRDCGLRERIQGLIVGVEREGQRILNPDSAMMLKSGDLVWVVGDRSKLSS